MGQIRMDWTRTMHKVGGNYPIYKDDILDCESGGLSLKLKSSIQYLKESYDEYKRSYYGGFGYSRNLPFYGSYGKRPRSDFYAGFTTKIAYNQDFLSYKPRANWREFI